MKIRTTLSWSISALLVLLFISSGYAGSLEEEAKQEIISFYLNKRLITKCGHAWYSYVGLKNPQALAWSIIEYQGLSAEVKAQPVHHADKLKGVEWQGSGTIRQAAWRMYHETTGWGSWQPPSPNERGRVFLGKKKGKWIVIPNGALEETVKFAKPLACEKLATIPTPP
jgi:hypothetical protein